MLISKWELLREEFSKFFISCSEACSVKLNMITPFSARIFYKYVLKISSGKLVGIRDGSFGSQFQPTILPLVYPSINECKLIIILNSPVLKDILYTDYIWFQNTGQISRSWCLLKDLRHIDGKVPRSIQTRVENFGEVKVESGWDNKTVVEWDGDDETVVVSDCGETEIGSESLLDSKVSHSRQKSSWEGIFKSNCVHRDLTEEYINDQRVLIVLVNKGKEVDFNAYDFESGTDNNDESDPQLNLALNESRLSQINSGRIGESANMGSQGQYGGSNNISWDTDACEASIKYKLRFSNDRLLLIMRNMPRKRGRI